MSRVYLLTGHKCIYCGMKNIATTFTNAPTFICDICNLPTGRRAEDTLRIRRVIC